MPHIKAKYLEPQRGVGYHGSFLGIADGPIVANDLVVPSGYSGDQIKWRQAQASDAARRLGVMAVADHAASDGGTIRIVTHKLITGVDTSGSTALGHAIYLSDSAGVWGTSAGTASIVVGTVLVDHASTGALLLAPGHSVGIE